MIYFIQEGEDGPVKIGVSNDIKRRLKILQTGNSNKLRLLGQIEGGYKLETILHNRFDSTRINSEWFEPSQELLDFIVDSCGYKPPYIRTRSLCSRNESEKKYIEDYESEQGRWVGTESFFDEIRKMLDRTSIFKLKPISLDATKTNCINTSKKSIKTNSMNGHFNVFKNKKQDTQDISKKTTKQQLIDQWR